MDDRHLNEYRRLARRAGHCMDAGRYSDAIAALEEMLAAFPDDAWALASMAECFLELGHTERCRELAMLALQADPEGNRPLCLLCRAELARGRPHDAYAFATRAVEADAGDAYALFLLGLCAVGIDRLEEATILGGLLLEQVPDTILGHQVLAMAAEERHDVQGAVRHLQTLLSIDPTASYGLAAMARLQASVDQDLTSAALFEAALHEDPHDTDRQLAFRDVLHRLADYGEPGARWRSIAGGLTALTAGLVLLWALLLGLVEDPARQALLNRACFVGIPLLLVAVLVLFRDRLMRDRSPQLALAFRYLRQQARPGTLAGLAVIFACVAGTTAVLLRSGIDALWAWAPAWLPFAAAWLAVTWMAGNLLRRRLLDALLPPTVTPEQAAALVQRWNRRLLLFLGIASLWLASRYQLGWLMLVAAALLAATAAAWYRRLPWLTAAVVVCCGTLLAAFADRFPDVLDLRPGMLGLLFVMLGAAMVYKAGRAAIERHLQRRRMAKLLGTGAQAARPD